MGNSIEHNATRWLLLTLSTVLLCMPAIYNGFPLLFFDSFDYLAHGYSILDTLVTATRHNFYGYRSHFYSLFLALLHATGSLWIVPVVQGLILSYVLLLCFRVVAPGQSAAVFLVGVAVLSLGTSASWFVSFVMPDVFAAVLILAAFLLGPCRTALDRGAIALLLAISLFSILVHPSHFALAAGLAVVVLLTALVERSPRQGLVSSGILGGLVGIAMLLTVGLSALLYGTAGFYRHSPPFLLARSIGDGPGRAFLKHDCVERRYAICVVADDLPTTSSEFLWGEHSLLKTASPDLVQHVKDEELAVVLDATQAYPLWQLRRSFGNFVWQLFTFDLYSFDGQDYYDKSIPQVLHSQRGQYLESRQHARSLPLRALTWMQEGLVWVGLGLVVWLSHRAWRAGLSRLVELTAVVGLGMIGNAFVTGVFSTVLGRYQSRVAWLVVAVALLLAAANSCKSPSGGTGILPAWLTTRPRWPRHQGQGHTQVRPAVLAPCELGGLPVPTSGMGIAAWRSAPRRRNQPGLGERLCYGI